jgi:hypothetical protein
VTAAGPAGGRPPLRPDRVYLGWQYALLHPHPGPSPRRPTPPPREQLNPGWVSAQRREQNRLDRPLTASFGGAIVLAAGSIALGVLGWLNPPLSGLGAVAGLAGAVLAARQIRRGEQALRGRVAAEERRVGTIRDLQEARLFEWQARHAGQARDWQARRAAYERQKHWYAVSLGCDIDRVDVAGGTLSGWSAVLTMTGIPRLQSGGELTVVDLTGGAVARDLLAVSRRAGINPLVWVLPDDLPRMDLGTGLAPAAHADLLSLAARAGDEQGAAPGLSRDSAMLERVIGLLGRDATMAQINAALRVLGHIGDPREDARRGLLTTAQIDQLAVMFGRGAGQVVVERAWALESRLRKLDSLGSALGPAPRSRLRVLATGGEAGVTGHPVLSTYVVAALTPAIRGAAGVPWQHTVFLLGAEELAGDVLDRLADACAASRTGLVVGYRSIPASVRERLGRGNAAVAFMRLGNAVDAKAASEQIGTEHRFVLAQLTDTVGASVTDTTGDSYTSTVGSSDSLAQTSSVTDTSGRSRGRGAGRDSSFVPFGHETRSRSSDSSRSTGYTESEAITEGISESTAWGISTSRAAGMNQSQARTVQRSREFVVEQHELQQLPPSAMIVTYAAADGRHVVMADANPAIMNLPTATLASLEEARRTPQEATPQEGTRPAPDRGHGPAEPGPAGSQPDRRPGEYPAQRADAPPRPRDGRDTPPEGTGENIPGPDAVPGADRIPGPEPPGADRGPGRHRRVPVSWRDGAGQPPPNLGPPPERLDWRRRPDE